jgi:aspartyl-tRNA(Asn)/glutamyl-tRNA(Gln) amidotransferase subunit C
MAESPSDKPTFMIDANMVKHVAFLVRLGILDSEAEAFSHQFTEIIDYFHLLNEVDTEAVTPASQGSALRSVMRKDVVQPSMPREDFLKNVPHSEAEEVQVPQVFGEEG